MVVPPIRVRSVNGVDARPQGEHVVYWMTAARRTRFNFGFERAVAWAARLGKPLVVLEALRAGYPYASDRLHAFALQGMAANAAALAGTPVLYHPYVEPDPGAGKGLVAALAKDACAVVADEWPYLFLPRMLAAAGEQVRVRLEAVGSCGLLPLRASERSFATAYAFRAFLQKHLPPHLAERPLPDPLKKAALPPLRALPADVARRWPAASKALLAARPAALAELPIDHGVAPVALQGGAAAGAAVLGDFVDARIERYAQARREALAILFELNDRYAVDGRDTNSVSGITWVLGRYDRPWPERPIYGKVRSMSSDSTRRKLDADAYIARWSECTSAAEGLAGNQAKPGSRAQRRALEERPKRSHPSPRSPG